MRYEISTKTYQSEYPIPLATFPSLNSLRDFLDQWEEGEDKVILTITTLMDIPTDSEQIPGSYGDGLAIAQDGPTTSPGLDLDKEALEEAKARPVSNPAGIHPVQDKTVGIIR